MTTQAHEYLMLDGEPTTMAFCPPVPDGHPRIRWGEAKMVCTALWRGYVGTWEVKDGRFYLIGLSERAELLGDGPLLADWFTGVLRVPRGERLHDVHMGFGSVYERELHVKIEAGVVVARREIDNRDKPAPGFWAGYEENMPGRENRFEGDDW